MASWLVRSPPDGGGPGSSPRDIVLCSVFVSFVCFFLEQNTNSHNASLQPGV